MIIPILILVALISTCCGGGDNSQKVVTETNNDGEPRTVVVPDNMKLPGPGLLRVHQLAKALEFRLGEAATKRDHFALGENVVWEQTRQLLTEYQSKWLDSSRESMAASLANAIFTLEGISLRAALRKELGNLSDKVGQAEIRQWISESSEMRSRTKEADAHLERGRLLLEGAKRREVTPPSNGP